MPQQKTEYEAKGAESLAPGEPSARGRDESVASLPRPSRFLVAAAVIVFYIFACASETYYFAPVQELDPFLRLASTPVPPVRGFEILKIGWLGLWAFAIAWYANPLFLVSLVLFLIQRYRPASYLAVPALVIGATSLLVREWPPGGAGAPVYPILAWGPGIFLWLSSLALLAVSSVGFHLSSATQVRMRQDVA